MDLSILSRIMENSSGNPMEKIGAFLSLAGWKEDEVCEGHHLSPRDCAAGSVLLEVEACRDEVPCLVSASGNAVPRGFPVEQSLHVIAPKDAWSRNGKAEGRAECHLGSGLDAWIFLAWNFVVRSVSGCSLNRTSPPGSLETCMMHPVPWPGSVVVVAVARAGTPSPRASG